MLLTARRVERMGDQTVPPIGVLFCASGSTLRGCRAREPPYNRIYVEFLEVAISTPVTDNSMRPILPMHKEHKPKNMRCIDFPVGSVDLGGGHPSGNK